MNDGKNRKKHLKKMIAPIVITILLVVYFVFYGVLLFQLELSVGVRILAAVIPAALGGTAIGVCLQRLKEIRSGEEDDLSQY